MSNRVREILASFRDEPDRSVPDQLREELIQAAYGHKCATEHYSPAEQEVRFEAFRTEHLQLTTDDLHAAKDRYKLEAENSAADGFEARLREYRRDASVQYEERDGTLQSWPKLSPEGKLAFLARDAASAGTTDAHFAKAVREFLGDVPLAEREVVALNMILDQSRELHAIVRLIPDHLSHDQLPLSEQVKDIVDSHQAAMEQIEQQERGR